MNPSYQDALEAEVVQEFRRRLVLSNPSLATSGGASLPPSNRPAQRDGTPDVALFCAVLAPASEAPKSASGLPPSAVVGPTLTASAHGADYAGARTFLVRHPFRSLALLLIAFSALLFAGFVVAS